MSIAINTRLYVHLATVFKPLDCSVWWSGLVPSVAAASDPLWGAGAAATRGHEEPKNQGSWYQIQHHLKDCLSAKQNRYYAGRDTSAAPAVGFYKLHVQQQEQFIEEAFTILSN